MAIQLYDVSVKTSLQIVGATIQLMKKAEDHFGSEKANELLKMQLTDDMFPLAFQINSVRHHSLGAVEGMRRGEFNPPPKVEFDFAGFTNYLAEALQELEQIDASEINALEGRPMKFKMGESFEIPFTTENFAASFSIPNLMFHAATLYDMFRMQGLAIGKQDFLGQMRIGH